MGSLAFEGDQGVGERPLLVLAPGGLCRLTPAATVRNEEWNAGEPVGERPVVLGLIENHDLFIKFSFVWV